MEGTFGGHKVSQIGLAQSAFSAIDSSLKYSPGDVGLRLGTEAVDTNKGGYTQANETVAEPLRLSVLVRPWPHEIIFGVFFLVAWTRLVWAAGFFHPSSLTFLAYFLGGFGLMCWGQHRPTPMRWRVRILFFAGISTGSYLSLRDAIPAMYSHTMFKVDGLLQSMDQVLTGGHLDFLFAAGDHPLLVDLFTGCYLFFFYYLIAGPAYYYFTNVNLFRKIGVGMFSLYGLGYLGYILAPAIGPHELMGAREGSFFGEVGNTFVINHSNGFDAFPSIHFGATFFLLAFDWEHYRRRFWLLLLPTLGLWVATVFLRYHYFVDLLGGLAVALVALWITREFGRSRTDEVPIGEDSLILGAQDKDVPAAQS